MMNMRLSTRVLDDLETVGSMNFAAIGDLYASGAA